MTHRISALPVLLSLLVLSLAGCAGDEVSRTFGIVRDTPDEFTVTTRAPLSMPPEYALRPPRPGAARPQEQTARNAAESALVPQAAFAGGNQTLSAGQRALLDSAGRPAPGDIRAKIDEDAALIRTDRSFADRLLFWRSPPPPGTVVDPTREAQRLRENAALGQGPQQGDTPIIQRSTKSFFDMF